MGDHSSFLHYEKRRNTELFKTMQKLNHLQLTDAQNYIPIYSKFFLLNETNYNSINLNHEYYVYNIIQENEDNGYVYKCEIKRHSSATESTIVKKIKKNVFFKMAPLLDPFKYLIGKYNIHDPALFRLPKYNSVQGDVYPKLMDANNSSYVDGFFVFLSSLMLNKYHFVHGLDFYGSFLAIKNNFSINVIDDIEYLDKSDFFNEYKNKLFFVEDYQFLLEQNNKISKPLIVIDKNGSNQSRISIQSLQEDMFEDIFVSETNTISKSNSNEQIVTLQDIKEMSLEVPDFNILINNSIDGAIENKPTTLKSNSTCSSRTSHTSNDNKSYTDKSSITSKKYSEVTENNAGLETEGDEKEDCGSGSGSEWEDINEEEESEFMEEQHVGLTIPKFPVNVICMEHCEDTFDNLIDANENLTEEEWFSALMQIVMILLTYQKVFSFTHNDLHTNNVMYNSTKKKYLYYCYKKKYYRVPTYGRIFKIIDFGRGIYKFDKKLFCSDSFQMGADAATQYNMEPYFNEKKPRLEPNPSFDLCRLACSIFDYLIEDMEEVSPQNLPHCPAIVRLIHDWCLDDQGINILYKNNGSERYPDFKLYKMIARLVHRHTPQAQLERKEFAQYQIQISQVEINEPIMNIDELPCLV